jgi:branched-subunit amino acid ABC-type transport system permease component
MSVPAFTIVQGVILGLNYGLLAMGLVLIYRTNRVLNFAQGQLGVVAAVFLVKLYYDFGINYWAAVVMVLAVAGFAGAVSELVLRRLFNRPRVMVMVATIGLSQVLFLFTVLPFIRPRQLYRSFPVPIHASFKVGTFLFQSGDVLTLVVAPLAAIALAAFIRLSPWGLAMRAMSENTDSARLSGVWVRRTSTVAWTVAGVLSAITAILASPGQTSALTQVLSPDLLLRALTAALIGAMVSLPVAFVAGIGIGIVQEVLVWNITNTATIELILFALLLAVLLVRVGA